MLQLKQPWGFVIDSSRILSTLAMQRAHPFALYVMVGQIAVCVKLGCTHVFVGVFLGGVRSALGLYLYLRRRK